MDQVFNDETLGRKARQNLVEGDDDHAVDAELFQRPGLGVARREAKDRVWTAEKIGRMRLESKHRAVTVEFLRQRPGALYHREMTAMNAIEIADRDHRARKSGRRHGRIDGGNKFFSGGRIGQGNPNRKAPCGRRRSSGLGGKLHGGTNRVKTAPCRLPGTFYQTNAEIAAVGAKSAASKNCRKAAASSAAPSAPCSSLRWMPDVTKRLSKPWSCAPLISVRMASPITRTRARSMILVPGPRASSSAHAKIEAKGLPAWITLPPAPA